MAPFLGLPNLLSLLSMKVKDFRPHITFMTSFFMIPIIPLHSLFSTDTIIKIILFIQVQWTLSISTTLYLKHLSVSNNFSGPLNISTKYTLFFSLSI